MPARLAVVAYVDLGRNPATSRLIGYQTLVPLIAPYDMASIAITARAGKTATQARGYRIALPRQHGARNGGT